MGAGLSLAEQVAELRRSKVMLQAGETWNGRLENWLKSVLPPGAEEQYGNLRSHIESGVDGPNDDETFVEWTNRRRAGVQTWSFPTEELRTEYLQSLPERNEADGLALLGLFLFEESCFGKDSKSLVIEPAALVVTDPSMLPHGAGPCADLARLLWPALEFASKDWPTCDI